MAVAMASSGSNFGLYSNLKTMEKQPSLRAAPFICSFGLDPVQLPCIIPRRSTPVIWFDVQVLVARLSFYVLLFLRVSLSSSTSAFISKASPTPAVENGSSQETDAVPTPIVIIDQDSDPDATIVEITFGDRLGALLDTSRQMYLDSSGKHNKFAITQASTGRKVDEPELLEAIRLTIINNLLEFHPESSARLAMGVAFGATPPSEQVDVDIATHVHVYDDSPEQSLLVVETADRPGLLVDLVKIITDIILLLNQENLILRYGLGLLAKAKFHVSYKGKAIIKPLQQVLANSLRYFLRRPSTEEASF
ncbi:UNVERIFIED_CONTAM: ACT domain-containing protein ACR11 [Sesamum calycinum]|uniref:ACT domain-containing protein ACR n=1 Tax=Sesamum calycinum TaxID=2727403 RepID=A0AAW2NFA1_9LAMI